VTPGQLLRDARRRHYATQKQLAVRAGTSQAAISRIERDEVSPTVETLARLLDLLGETLTLEARPVHSGVDRSLFELTLALTPDERTAAGTQAARSLGVLRVGSER
jgi:transcriptional regulator with XRE-family HTH domain